MNASEALAAIRTLIVAAAGIHESLVVWSDGKQGHYGWTVPATDSGEVGVSIQLLVTSAATEHQPPRVVETAEETDDEVPVPYIATRIISPWVFDVVCVFEALDQPADATVLLIDTVHRLQYPAAREAQALADVKLVEITPIQNRARAVDDRILDVQGVTLRWRAVVETILTASAGAIDDVHTLGTLTAGTEEIAVAVDVERPGD